MAQKIVTRQIMTRKIAGPEVLALDLACPAREAAAMAEDRYQSLTGTWTGIYDYAGDHARDHPESADAVPFNALITDIVGSVSGETVEPNTFASADVEALYALIEGTRTGQDIAFIKTYDGTGGQSHAIAYEGRANAALSKVEGSWTARGPGGMTMSGGFVMNRSEFEIDDAIERELVMEEFLRETSAPATEDDEA